MNTDTPPILYHSFKHHLKTTDFNSYSSWVNRQGNDYRTINLDDNSEWTLRIVDQTNYIHIHPARYTIHTRRVKANILKTVVCALLFDCNLDYNNINTIRTERLRLSPIDTTKKHEELDNVFLLLRDNVSFSGMPKNLIQYIEHTRKRPGMFFGSLDGRAFNRLQAYIWGYETACKIHGIEEMPKFSLADFNQYVADYYQDSASVDCFTLILTKSYNNELQAFNTFYKLFDAFCEKSGLK